MAKEPDRLPHETAKSYAAFIEFVRLGPKRTREQAAKRIGNSRFALEKLSQKYNWTKRAEEYDARVQAEDQEAMDLFRKESRAAAQRFEIRRQELMRSMAESAIRRVQEMLDSGAKLTKVETKNGKDEIVFRNSFPLMHVSLLMREANRAALSAVTDAYSEAEARIMKGARVADQDGTGVITSRIAGNFSCGDQMFDGSQPPPLPENAKIVEPEKEPPLVDLTGTPYEQAGHEPLK